MDTDGLTENRSKHRIVWYALGIVASLTLVIIGSHFAAKSSFEDYARSKAYPIYPNSTHISTDETSCPELAEIDKCITVIYCTEDDVSEVVAYLEEQSATVEPAPEALFGKNMFLLRRANTWLDEVMYYVAGEPDGILQIEMFIGQNNFTVEQYPCDDQTIIASHVRWTKP
jgi:hypothetical protein